MKWLISIVLACALAGAAYALDVKAGGDCMAVPAGGHVFSLTVSQSSDLPSGYTVWSKDGSAFYLTRNMGGTAESISAYVRANESILIPAPEAIYNGTQYVQIFTVSAHTDSCFALPWYE